MSTRKLELGGYLYSPFIDDSNREHELAHPIIKLTPARVTIVYRGEPLALDRRKLEETGRWDPSPRIRRKLPTFFVEPTERGRR